MNGLIDGLMVCSEGELANGIRNAGGNRKSGSGPPTEIKFFNHIF